MKRAALIFGVLLIALFLLGCPIQLPGTPPSSNNTTTPPAAYTCANGTVVSNPDECKFKCADGTKVDDPKKCPRPPKYICDDGTIVDDLKDCPKPQNYTCPDGTIVPNPRLCPVLQCLPCDDNNPCTRDYCGAATDYACAHEKLTGQQPNCTGSVSACKYNTCIDGECVLNATANCCGNDKCEPAAGENCSTCFKDCGACPYNPYEYPALKATPTNPLELSPAIYDCDSYPITISVYNPLTDYNLLILGESDNVISIKTPEGAICRVPSKTSILCVVTMSGALGYDSSGVFNDEARLMGREDKEYGPYNYIYKKAINATVTYSLTYYDPPKCMLWCKTGNEWKDPGSSRIYSVIGPANYKDDRRCHAKKVEGAMTYDAYFTEWNKMVCIISDSPTTARTESCKSY